MSSSYKILDSSWRSISSVAVPIIFAVLSHNVLFVIDRMMLMHYSIDAMNAVAASSNLCAVLVCFFNGLAGTAEIYVGQFNGSKQYKMVAQPSWQMIYMAILSIMFFAPMGYWAEQLNLLPAHYLQAGVNYQRIVMYGSPLAVVYISLSTFFIGQGRSTLVTLSAVIGALSNVLLDYLFIYGINGLLPAYGEKGAAAATIIANLITIVILAINFFSSSNRKQFCTAKPRWMPTLFRNIIKVGLPVAFNETITILSWFLILSMVNHTSKELTTIYTLEINVYMLMIFVGDGLCKTSAAINSNLIGQNNLKEIRTVVKKLAIIATALIALLSTILAAGCNKWLANCNYELLTIIASNQQGIINSLHLLILGVLAESLLSVLWGVLLAGGDTYFAAISYQVCLWLGTVLPLSFMYFTGRLSRPEQPFLFSLCWSVSTMLCYLVRYRSLKWYQKVI